MEKSELKLLPHILDTENHAVEVRYEGKLIATVYGADGPGVRIMTKYPYDIVRGGIGDMVKVIEVRIEPS